MADIYSVDGNILENIFSWLFYGESSFNHCRIFSLVSKFFYQISKETKFPLSIDFSDLNLSFHDYYKIQYVRDRASKSYSREQTVKDINHLLGFACGQGFVTKIDTLIEAGADINNTETFEGQLCSSPLYEVCSNWCRDIKLLDIVLKYEEIDVNYQNPIRNMNTPLIASQHKLNFVQTLIKHPKIDLNILNDDKRSALLVAFYANRFESVEELIKHKRVDVSIKDTSGFNILLLAAFHGHINIVKLLMEKENIDCNVKVDDLGFSALDLAKSNNHPEIVEMLEAKIQNKKIQN